MLILASGSPRRRELLARITPDFVVRPTGCDETLAENDPARRVLELSRRKALAAAPGPGDIVLAADTIVALDGDILEKPADADDARRMTFSQRRTVIGFRYYLDAYQFSAYNTPVTVAENVDIDTVARIAERSLDLPGVTIGVSGTREYETTYAAHVLGRVAALSPEEYEQKKDLGYAMRAGTQEQLAPEAAAARIAAALRDAPRHPLITE